MTRPPSGQATLPPDHVLVPDLLAAVDQPYARRDFENLLDQDQPIWVGWLDPLPATDRSPAFPGSLFALPTLQVWYSRSTPVARVDRVDPATQSCLTRRTVTRTLTDSTDLTVQVWRLYRADRTGRCTESRCVECGSSDYWNDPGLAWPDPELGLADPEHPDRCDPRTNLLLALGSSVKVVLTDHARYSRGQPGNPHRRRRGRLQRISHTSDRGDLLHITWRDGSMSALAPSDVRLATDADTGDPGRPWTH